MNFYQGSKIKGTTYQMIGKDIEGRASMRGSYMTKHLSIETCHMKRCHRTMQLKLRSHDGALASLILRSVVLCGMSLDFADEIGEDGVDVEVCFGRRFHEFTAVAEGERLT